MKKIHQFLQIALLLYFGVFLIFFISFNTLSGLFNMQEITSDSMVTITLIGLVIFLISWLLGRGVTGSLSDKIKKMDLEINSLKAKIYDFEHPKRSSKPVSPSPQSSPATSGSVDSEQSNIPPRQNFVDE